MGAETVGTGATTIGVSPQPEARAEIPTRPAIKTAVPAELPLGISHRVGDEGGGNGTSKDDQGVPVEKANRLPELVMGGDVVKILILC